jgi:hypothetical protein
MTNESVWVKRNNENSASYVESEDKFFSELGQWQPIETAPKDGSAILACYAPHYDTNGFLPVAVRWRTYHPNATGKPTWRTSNGTKIGAITHWMPLPEPPTMEEDNGR